MIERQNSKGGSILSATTLHVFHWVFRPVLKADSFPPSREESWHFSSKMHTGCSGVQAGIVKSIPLSSRHWNPGVMEGFAGKCWRLIWQYVKASLYDQNRRDRSLVCWECSASLSFLGCYCKWELIIAFLHRGCQVKEKASVWRGDVTVKELSW